MFFVDGPEFVNASPEEVINYLSSLDKLSVSLNKSEFKFVNRGKFIALQVFNNKKEFLIRKSFLYKYLKKFKFPVKLLGKFSPDTVSSILNDLLISFKSKRIFLTVENDQVVSFKVDNSKRINELELILTIQNSKNKIKSINRNDFVIDMILEKNFFDSPIDGIINDDYNPTYISENVIKYNLD